MSYAARVWNDTWMNYSVLRHGAFDGFLVTSKNSGTHWIKYMLAVALADTYGIARPEYFSENAVRPYIGWPKDDPAFPQLPRLAFSHSIPHRLADWGWARSMAGLPPYTLCVRHPMSILASHHAKWKHDIRTDWLDYLHGDPRGKRYRCDLYWISRFWNRWGEIEKRHPDAVLRVHYEQVEDDARGTLEAIARHWGITLKPEAIDAAVEAGTKDAMAQKIDPQAERNVLQNRQAALEVLYDAATTEIYTRLVKTLFRYDLGYDLLTPPTVSG